MNSNETESLIDRYKGAPDLDGFMGFACDAAPKKPQTLAQHLKHYHKGKMPKGDCSWLKQYKKDHPDWQKEAAKFGGGKPKVTKKEAAVDAVQKTRIGKVKGADNDEASARKISDHVKSIVEEKASRVFYDSGCGISKDFNAAIDGDTLTVDASDIGDSYDDDYIKRHVEDMQNYCKNEGVTLSDVKFTIEKYDTGKKYNNDYKDYWKKGDPIYAKKCHITAKIEGKQADERKAQREAEEHEVGEILKRQKDYKFNDPNVEISEKGFRVGDIYNFMLDGKPRRGKVNSINSTAKAGWKGIGLTDMETGKNYVCTESHLADCNPYTIGINLAADGQYGKRERVGDLDTAMQRLVAIANDKSDMDDCVRSLKELFFRTVHHTGTTIQSFGLDVEEPSNSGATANEAWQNAQNEKEKYLREHDPRRMWRDVKWTVSSNREAKHVFERHDGDIIDWDSERRTTGGIFPKTFKTKAEAQAYLDKKGYGNSWSVDTIRIADMDGMRKEIERRTGKKIVKTGYYGKLTLEGGEEVNYGNFFDWTNEN